MIGEENKPQEIIEELPDDDDIDLEAFSDPTFGKALDLTEPDVVPPEQPDNGKAADLMTEIMALRQQLEDKDSQYKRLFADFDNFRKRTEREKAEEEDKIGAKILKKFLTVVDDFERAQAQIKTKTEGETAIHNSYQSVYKQLVKSLKETGVTRMRTLHEAFDPNLHEAIAQEPSAEFEEGTVIDELRRGYLLGDRILRHALVRVSCAMPEDVTAADAESDH